MKTFAAVLSFFAITGAACAASATPSPWTGFYAGLNAGYGGGASNQARTFSTPLVDTPFSIAGPYGPLSNGFASVGAGDVNTNMSGFIGGGQLGYNFQWGTNLVIGAEADIQGAMIRGSGLWNAVRSDASSFSVRFTSFQGATYDLTRMASGRSSISAGVDWLGTARGRLGILVTPELFVYGSGGLAFGGASASAAHQLFLSDAYVITGRHAFLPTVVVTAAQDYPTSAGVAHFSDTRVGWIAGGGGEWLFMPRWSLKAEAYYYDLGSASFQASPVRVWNAGQLVAAHLPATRIRYDGIIARLGVNFHTDWNFQ